jgi:murein DD-endopeptidase MepM/ murein hydrolase activator NlpD
VQPGDVATPTATYAIILVPTATPTPVPESPVGESLDEPVGLHGAESFSTYTVKEGDTLLTVALEVGVDVEDLPCAVSPAFRSDQPLVIGDSIEVPPPSWRCHQVVAKESLTQVATRYEIDPIEIIEVPWNQLDGSALGDKTLVEGSYLRIPPGLGEATGGGFLNFMLDQPLTVSPITAYAIGGTKARTTATMGPLPKDWPYGSGNFMWPVFGWMSQGYRNDHRAIDIAATSGTFVTASDRGVVIRSGWNDQGYGMFVIVDHNIDYITLYAHLSEVYVKEGDVVAQGQIIGTIGSTGNSTGPHLHFEIRDFGRRANPLDLLIR